MNKRDFMKGGAALGTAIATAPTFSLAQAATATGTRAAQAVAASPVPAYVYDSARRVMKFYRGDDNTRAMHAYFAGA